MTPIPSATLVLLRDGCSGIEALITRRNTEGQFLGGVWVFPGGVVEKKDSEENEIQTAINAAVRETEEEVGIRAEPSSLLPVSRWVTPEGAPKRFSTWFFVTHADEQPVIVDGDEIMDSLWVRPEEAIKKHQDQEIDMLPPTLVSLSALIPFRKVAEVLSHYRDREPLHIFPRVNFEAEKLVMLYPGDAGYESQDATILSARHRCIKTDNGWEYINETEIKI